ncbi:AraC family transcriptional regulator [Dyadobacter fermentans]|uniref:Transcriptional regulator, AraC family n=1 Tax=Dyadobacter fermentans (strain ATCC 700827 / DSM 18053 / CIP 107007 / KCTC 52180 / NS114) TaxID=471854 RepID=C6VYH8_DYAFD|nr:helix-turn-helix transcriptional regulator [Dyadobacter fermentans]ACT91657.1 transcriptional regulator, AraC family [Dyadobacter fermentans DSM 18053]
MHGAFPRLDIGTLSEYREDHIMIARFSDYRHEHQSLVFPHRHSFYHLVLFTEGRGPHTIDFHRFQAEPFQVYFMIPGQVHSWDFDEELEGYVVNFSDSFFKSFLLQPEYLDSFSFFDQDSSNNVVTLSENIRARVSGLFEELLSQNERATAWRDDIVRVLLLQIFLLIEQSDSVDRKKSAEKSKNPTVRNFIRLIDKHYDRLRLPGQYAEMLNVTPNHLNALCKEHVGRQAGELIRNRIVLEAKRLLINLDLTVSQIAYKLNFSDNSYFTKFFRKETGMTPEDFRKSPAI